MPSAGSSPPSCTTRGTTPCPRSGSRWRPSSRRGPRTLVLAAATGQEGYDERPVLDEAGWSTLLGNLDRLAALAAEGASPRPCTRTSARWWRTPPRCSASSTTVRIGLCLDTGHLLIGGADPVALARDHAARIRHTHLKDVDAGWAARVRSGEVGYTEAVRQGMYRPLGQGDVDIAAIVGSLEAAGYGGLVRP